MHRLPYVVSTLAIAALLIAGTTGCSLAESEKDGNANSSENGISTSTASNSADSNSALARAGESDETPSGVPVNSPDVVEDMTAGEWEVRSRIISLDGPMVTPEVRTATMRDGDRSEKFCMSTEDLRNIPRNIGSQFKGACDISNATLAAGKMASEASCKLPNGTAKTRANGTYSAKSYRMESRSVTSIPQGELTAVSEVTGKYLGPC